MTRRPLAERRRRLETAAQLRVVLYARKSGPGDRSVADQEKVGRRDIASIGAVVVAVYTDNLSASRYRRVQDRPGFVETKKFIRAGHADMLWTFANNRAHRTLDDYVELRALCVETGALWRYGNRTYDLTLSSDRQATASDALRSEGQSDDISDAVNRGIQTALEENKAHGKLLRGYRIIRDPNSGKAISREPIPRQAKLIQKAAERILAGETLRSVVNDFVPKWEKAGGTGYMDRRALRAMLINPTYAGLRTYKGEIHGPGDWAPILTLDTHTKLRAILTDPKRREQRGTEPVHFLSYIACCGSPGCGTQVGARVPRSHGREFSPIYRCMAGHLSRGIAAVDAHVEEVIIQLLERPDAKALLLANEEQGGSSFDDDIQLIEELRAQLNQYLRDAARTRMSARAQAVYVEQVEDDIREAQARIDSRTATIDLDVVDLVGPGARSRWKQRTLAERRSLVRRYFTVTIMPLKLRSPGNDVGVEVRPLKALG